MTNQLLETHAVEFLKIMGGQQAMESMHHDLLEEWGGEKVDESHPRYGEKLKQTMVRVNGKHI